MRDKFRRVMVAMLLPTLVALLVEYVTYILSKVTSNPNFPNPEPTPAQIQAAMNDLVQAETVSNTVKGTKGRRNQKMTVLRGMMTDLAAYVERVANADPERAVEIIESSGFHVKKSTVPTKLDFEVKQGKVSGEVLLIVKKVAPRSAYIWQYSTDQKTWTQLPVTLQAKTKLGGLTPGTTYFFRFRPVTKAGEGDWSHILGFLVK